MPFVNVRDLIRDLRHIIEQGHILEPPLEIITELGRHASLLSHATYQFTLRHDCFESNESFSGEACEEACKKGPCR
jgi:hypothetical protein